MTAKQFRRIALSLPAAVEGMHTNRVDFTVADRIFAALPRDQRWGVLMLTPEQQAAFVQIAPAMFAAVDPLGRTRVELELVHREALETALELAWTNQAPKKLVARLC